ncbi:MAG: acyl-protein synthetase [Clostridiales Family XIII bacterium]|jgi:phenylacetate-coenzyme A ligase PaaK-like adenylate-forming protein|nr:acyl-protein synthetase [Clostridiales Family XIII bacterium]
MDVFFDTAPYSPGKDEKGALLSRRLFELTRRHYERCEPYRNIIDGLGFDLEKAGTYYDLPFLPVSLFKQLDLTSVPKEEIFKTMTSSGTTGQAVSRIYLDRETANLQQKALSKIVSSFLGASRLPMLIIDCPSVVKDRTMFSARGAGILGFSFFGTSRAYALHDDMSLDMESITDFFEKFGGRRVLLFGFTFMVWQHFVHEIEKLDIKPDLSQGILIHGGGWKKLAADAVSPAVFKKRLYETCGIREVHDYYGMVEQTGAIYMECEEGHLHASVYSDVITRDFHDFSVCGFGETGIIEVVSALPASYPGHALLTEDEGVVLGEDDCPCGRQGKYFKIQGRLKNAEIRGCSDTYAAGL